jgi:hypothetical protein
MSVTKRIANGDYNLSTAATANVNITTGNLVITGIGGTLFSLISSNISTTSNTLANIGLSFNAVANALYRVQAKLIFQHSSGSTDTHSWTLRYDAGTAKWLTQQQTSNTSSYTQSFLTSNSQVSTATTAQAGIDRFAEIEGTFTHSATANVNIQFSTSGGNLTVRPNSYLLVSRIA